MQDEMTTLGGLRCRLVGAEAPGPDGLAVVLCHGYGAPGDDLVSLAPEVLRAAPALEGRVCFVFPEAPLELPQMGPWDSRAWWPLDERILDAALAKGRPIDSERAAPSELPALRGMLARLLAELESRHGFPISRTLLGGFSQGAMLATDTVLRLPLTPAGLCVFSGTLFDEEAWTRLAPDRKGMPALVSHGRQDPLLSFPAAERLYHLLADAGVAAKFVPFDGPHTIAPEGFAAFVGLLRTLAEQ
jgi:phospholipase/carboxylesterase